VKKILIVLGLVCSLLIVGCSVNPSGISDDYAKEFARKITYMRDDRTGLCFGVVATRKTGSVSSTGIGVTCVPCETVEHLLAN